MAEIGTLRNRLAAASGPERARLAVELCEREPLMGHRAEVIRAAIREAGAALDAAPDRELEARVLLRLASVKMVELDWDGADQALAAAGDRVDRQGPWMYLGAARSCRVAVRRGAHDAATATLTGAARHVDTIADHADPRWRRVVVEIALGIAECAIHEAPGDPAPFDTLIELARELRHEPQAWADALFTARQLLATDSLARSDAGRAADHLREVVKLAHDHDSPADEVEARLARAAALSARGDRAGGEEAERVIQVARDRALERGLEDLHVATLIAQAGLMSQRGKTAGALERCLEIARVGQAGGDLRRYVAAVGLMSQIYQNHGDFPSAYRTIADSYHALRSAQGDAVKPLFTPLLETLRDRVGADRFQTLVDDVNRARALAESVTAHGA